jgi:hypothetical protein
LLLRVHSCFMSPCAKWGSENLISCLPVALRKRSLDVLNSRFSTMSG